MCHVDFEQRPKRDSNGQKRVQRLERGHTNVQIPIVPKPNAPKAPGSQCPLATKITCSRSPMLSKSSTSKGPMLPNSHAPKVPCSQSPMLPKSHAPKAPCSQSPMLPKSHAPKCMGSHGEPWGGLLSHRELSVCLWVSLWVCLWNSTSLSCLRS